jgi:hypothetical protein
VKNTIKFWMWKMEAGRIGDVDIINNKYMPVCKS